MNRQEVAALLARAGKREIVEFDGLKVEVVELSFGARTKFAQLAEEGGVAIMRFIIRTCCYEPGTAHLIFVDDELVDMLPGPAAQLLAETAYRLSGMNKKQEALPADPDVETSASEPSEAEKNG